MTHSQAEQYLSPHLSISKLQLSLQGTPWEGMGLEPLRDKGLAHLHIRLLGSGQLLRVPKQSQLGLDPRRHLEYEAACFRLASPSMVTPVLHRVLPVCRSLPRGALVVDAIEGRPARLPRDLPAICRSLAAIHRLPSASEWKRALRVSRDPLKSMIEEVDQQARYLDAPAIPSETRRLLLGQMDWVHSGAFPKQRPPCSLITFDAHPGNFIVGGYHKAWVVDLEKCRISYPGFDLAHATLYTSTTWDVESRAVLSLEDIVQAYRTWEAEMNDGRKQRVWHAPLRRLMWLWSVTWCSKWLVQSLEKEPDAGVWQNWSADNNASELNEYVRERTLHYLDPGVIGRVMTELDELARLFS